MKPENILQADLLDILFDERNKAYGAYTLRKNYDKRLLKSFAFTSLFTLLLAVAHIIQSKYREGKVSSNDDLLVHRIEIIKSVEDHHKNKPERKIKKPPIQLAQKAYVVPEVVKDHLANKDLPEVKELDNNLISNINKAGMDAHAGEVVVPADDDGEGGRGNQLKSLLKILRLQGLYLRQK